jgi:DNA-binding NarL/FixJ family response regulator
MQPRSGNRNRDARCPENKQAIRVVVAEDEALLRNAVAQLLGEVAGGSISVVGTCATREHLLRLSRIQRPDVILLDLRMPDRDGGPCTLSGPEAVALLRRQQVEVGIICLSAHGEPGIVRGCLQAGAMGFLGKGVRPAEIWTAIQTVQAGGLYIEPTLRAQLDLLDAGPQEDVKAQLLAGRRGDVLRLLLDGHSPSEIADALPIGKKHVDKKISEIKAILGVSTPIRIYRMCRQLGIVED